MPEPLVYLKTFGAAAVPSALVVLAIGGMRRWSSGAWRNAACVLAIGFGLALAYWLSTVRLAWPPRNGLDRFLTIIVPVALGIELIAGLPRVPRGVAWLGRLSLAAAAPGILLYGSVYLSEHGDAWTTWQAAAAWAMCSGLLVFVWALLSWLSERSPGNSIPFALALAIQCAGITIMLAGYLNGGAASFPLTGALVGTTIASGLIGKRAEPAILGIGVVGLFGLLFVGRFFGRLSTGDAMVMLLAPLLCWATEAPLLRRRRPWLVGSLRLLLVAIPLAAVLVGAKRDFDRNMAPLLQGGGRITH